jgi:hypothetical protein
LDRRAALRLAVAMCAVQVVASAFVVAITPHSSSGGLAEFPLYFAVGDWLAVRLPLAAAAGAAVVGALINRTSDSSATVPHGRLYRAAALLRLMSVGTGIACGSLTIGVVSWQVALRVEATQRFFPHYLDWSAASVGYVLLVGVTIGLVSVVFAFEPDDAPRAAYFALCFGLLALFMIMAVLAYDVVGAAWGSPALAALFASGLTLVTATHRLRTLLAIVLAIFAVVALYVVVFNTRATGALGIGLLVLQVLSISWLTRPTVAAVSSRLS